MSSKDNSLDSFLYDPTDRESLSKEEKERFERWMERVLSDQSKVTTMIVDALKDGMYTEWKDESLNHKFKLGSYYPSMIERCLRQQAYTYTDPLPPTHEELNIFGEGRAIHELIALALRRSGLVSVEGREVVVDLNFNDEAKLHGRIDDLLLVRMTTTADGTRDGEFKLFVPLEIKSTSTLPDEPKQAHYYQLSTYLHANNYPLGVLLYWAKRGGEVRAFAIPKEEAMYYVLRERVLELHESLKTKGLPLKEASINKDYQQCEFCPYKERCDPFLLDSIPRGSPISLFDIDSTILDPSPRRRQILQELGLPTTLRPYDMEDGELKERYWKMYDEPKYIFFDSLVEQARERIQAEVEKGRRVIAISSSRRYRALEPTRAHLANLGVLTHHVILREDGNHDTDTRFKTRWATRLARNYEISEYFDRDAAVSAMIKRIAEHAKKAKTDVPAQENFVL